MHLLSKMRLVSEGGSRMAIVHNGSPLFSGGAGSGETRTLPVMSRGRCRSRSKVRDGMATALLLCQMSRTYRFFVLHGQ
jgi:hypothetical protein